MIAPVAETGGLSRRTFLGATGAIAFGAIAFSIARGPAAKAATGGITVNSWVTINPDNTVTVFFGGAEMGQGIMTGLTKAVAEELMVDWNQVSAAQAPITQAYATGGSTATRSKNKNAGNQNMRIYGAQIREMLLAAFQQQFGVSGTAASGVVTGGGKTATYAELAAAASKLTPPATPPLTPPSAWRLIGKNNTPRLDIPAKVTGEAVFGLDVVVPGMAFAAIRNAPPGGTLAAKPATPAGALAVVDCGNAVAVVHPSNSWAAMKAVQGLSVTWNLPANLSQMTSSTILSQAKSLMTSGTPTPDASSSPAADVDSGMKAAGQTLEATYWVPYLPHIAMEVLNATVDVKRDGAGSPVGMEIWAPTQSAAGVQATAVAVAKAQGVTLDPSTITVHVTYLGGGLGRKYEQDYVAQAVKVGLAVKVPVKTMWRREEDLGHDQYRPCGLVRATARQAADGSISAWKYRIVAPSVLAQRGWFPSAEPVGSTDGAVGLPYNLGPHLVEYVNHPSPVPVGFWRSVAESMNVFVVESFIDELAANAKKDPVEYRRSLLPAGSRERAVLDAVAALGKWTTPAASGHAKGISMSFGFGSIVGTVVEISQPTAGQIKVHNVAVVIDCGTVVNPDQVVAQMEGGIIHGLSSTLWGQTTFSNGTASSRNFNNTRVLRNSETPVITVQTINGALDDPTRIGGVGEAGVPGVAPAVGNAFFRLTGTRLRDQPFIAPAQKGGSTGSPLVGAGGTTSGGTTSGGTTSGGTTSGGTTSGGTTSGGTTSGGTTSGGSTRPPRPHRD